MRKAWFLAVLFVIGCGGTAVDTQGVSGMDINPSGKGGGLASEVQAAKPTGQASTVACLSNHGGPVMTSCIHVYLIWYGNWSGDLATTIIPNFVKGVGGSPYFNINSTYGVPNCVTLSGQYNYPTSTSPAYSGGITLTDTNIKTIVTNSIGTGKLPSDASGVYFVLTSADVKESSGFCTQYCGWHTHASIGGVDIKYSLVGDPDTQCPSGCEWFTSGSCNGDAGADGMASVLAHELEETATDPDLNAWYNSSSGAENGDTCAWTFGTITGSCNLSLSTGNFLIQQNVPNTPPSCYCTMHYP